MLHLHGGVDKDDPHFKDILADLHATLETFQNEQWVPETWSQLLDETDVKITPIEKPPPDPRSQMRQPVASSKGFLDSKPPKRLSNEQTTFSRDLPVNDDGRYVDNSTKGKSPTTSFPSGFSRDVPLEEEGEYYHNTPPHVYTDDDIDAFPRNPYFLNPPRRRRR